MTTNDFISIGSLVTTDNDMDAVWQHVTTTGIVASRGWAGACSRREHGIVLGHVVELPNKKMKKLAETHWTLVAWSHGVVGWTPTFLLKTVHILVDCDKIATY